MHQAKVDCRELPKAVRTWGMRKGGGGGEADM